MFVLLLCAGLPYRAAAWLREQGTGAIHVRDIGMATAADPDILACARERRQVCITLDHDFHRILAETGATSPSVILLRTQFTGYLETARLIARLVSEVSPGTRSRDSDDGGRRLRPLSKTPAPARTNLRPPTKNTKSGLPAFPQERPPENPTLDGV
jgi:predicted nuclease of predicted toxin-antitoxin system